MMCLFMILFIANIITNIICAIILGVEEERWFFDMMKKKNTVGLSIMNILFLIWFWLSTLCYGTYYLYVTTEHGNKLYDFLFSPKFFNKKNQ